MNKVKLHREPFPINCVLGAAVGGGSPVEVQLEQLVLPDQRVARQHRRPARVGLQRELYRVARVLQVLVLQPQSVILQESASDSTVLIINNEKVPSHHYRYSRRKL